jgi:hypothetical protein
MKKAPAIKVTVLLVSALGAGYALGYLQGTGASHALALLGRLSLGAILFLILGVLAKVIVAVLLRRKGGQSPGTSDSGNGPRPPRAPVPRPGGGRPPSLSAAVDLKAGSNA